MIPSHANLILFMTAAVVLLAIPGPAVMYIVGRSISHGRAAGVVSALGTCAGTIVHVAAAAVGLSALLMSSATAFGVGKYLGAAYLVYLGVQRLRQDDLEEYSTDAPRAKLSRIFGQGVVVNVLNPKTALFFFAFLPQFVNPSRGSAVSQILFLGLLFMAMGVVSDSLWGIFSGTVAERFKRNPRWRKKQQYVSGGILISLGIATAVAGSGSRK